MACVSDIDLATLHKTRLEERVNYKLSFQKTQPHQTHHTDAGFSTMTRLCLQRNAHIYVANSCHYHNRHLATTDFSAANSKDLNGNCVMDSLTSNLKHLNFANEQKLLPNRGDSSSSLDDDEDFKYFSPTTRRRRSGTWP